MRSIIILIIIIIKYNGIYNIQYKSIILNIKNNFCINKFNIKKKLK